MKVLARGLVTVVSIGLIAACHKTPKALAPAVTLNAPEPPARVAIPVSLPEPEAEPAPPPAPPEAPKPSSNTPPPRSGERPAAATPPPPAPVEAPPPVAPTLQTTADIGALEQRTQQLLTEAQRNLDRVNYRDLGAQARAQYDSATGFIRNARQALGVKNYMYAEYLAVKAAGLARELVKG